MFYKYYSFLIYLIIVFYVVNKTNAQHVVWDDETDLCEYKEKPTNYRKATRCELLDNILVERRILRGRLYWCISVDNRNGLYKTLSIDYDGPRSTRYYDKYYMKAIKSNIDTQDKYSLENEVAIIVVYPRTTTQQLSKIISVKLDDAESCDQTRTLEVDPILPNQQNRNPFRYLNNCFDYNERPLRPRHNCEKLDEIIVEEFLYNNEIPFYCIIVLKNLRRQQSQASGEILEIQMSNPNARYTWTKDGVTKLGQGKWSVNGNAIRIASITAEVNKQSAEIRSIRINGIESCGLQQGQPPPPIPQETCGEVKLKHAAFIALGRPTEPGEFPWHIALFRLDSPTTRSYICGGTIVSNTVVLSAAHCVNTDNGITVASDLRVEAGKYDLTTSSAYTKEYQVQSVMVHEKFERQFLENDIVMIRLKTYIEFSAYIQPICLADDDHSFKNLIGFVPGWGRNEHNEKLTVLSKAGFPIISDQECRASNRDFFSQYLTDRSFCAGFRNGTNVCVGDSGGGLVFKVGNVWYLKGIVSLGVPIKDRCDITQYVLFTDMTKFYDWVINKL